MQLLIDEMVQRGADEVSLAAGLMSRVLTYQIVLETEHDNDSSLALYESMGFIREKRLHGFYTNRKDA